MLAQALMRELGMLFRGADDIVAWLCAACAFLALGHTFRRGELVRVGLILERLPLRARRHSETGCLAAALLFVGYVVFAVLRFVYESWKFNELAQGLVQIPIWIPQLSLAVGATVLLVAVCDDFVEHLRGRRTAYQAAEDERRRLQNFGEHL